MSEVRVPPVPRLDVKTILRRRDRLNERITTELTDERILVTVASTLHVSMELLRGMRLDILPRLKDQNQKRQTCWQLAGCSQWLGDGLATSADHWRTVPHWAAMSIFEVTPARLKNKVGAFVSLRILTGSAAGLHCRKFWSSAMFRFASRSVGFSAPWGSRPFHDPREFFGLRLAGYLDPTLARDDRPGFHKLDVPSGMQSENKMLIDKRKRITFRCPRNFPQEASCYLCPVGKDSCAAATHAKSYRRQHCAVCNTEALNDPAPGGGCLNCREQAISGRRSLL